MKKIITLFFIVQLLGCAGNAAYRPPREALTLEVPADFPSIQEAINHSYSGDTIIVAPGIYRENISFHGKNILLTSHFFFDGDSSFIEETVIDGGYSDNIKRQSAVTFENNESNLAILQGFTITNGRGSTTFWQSDYKYFNSGGGIEINHSSPTIRYNRITRNGSPTGRMNGGGISIHDGSNPRIINNEISHNQGSFGAGISIWGHCGGVIQNNLIHHNQGGHMYGGAGIAMDLSTTLIQNNTIVYNEARGNGNSCNGSGGALVFWANNAMEGQGPIQLRNNIIWGNTQEHGDAISFSLDSIEVEMTYSLVQGGYPGEGNITEEPQFEEDSYRLLTGSAGIDQGDPQRDFQDEKDSENGGAAFPAMGGLRNDMGAYGGMDQGVLLP